MPKISRRLFAATVALLAASSAGAAGAAEVKVLVLRCDAGGAAAARSGFRQIVES